MASILHRNTPSSNWPGLENGDNSCYANALIKALFPILALRDFLDTIVKSPAKHIGVQTRQQAENQSHESSIVKLLHQAIAAIETGSKLAAQELVKALKRLTIDQSKVGLQQDASEYGDAFGFFLNEVSSYRRKEVDVCSNRACMKYNQQFERVPTEEKAFIYLPIVENMSIFEQLENNILGVRKDAQCFTCKQRTKIIECSGIYEPPKLLPIVLQRNVDGYNYSRTNVEVPESGCFFGAVYRLVSAVCHDGESVNSGHYWAHVVEKNNSQTRHNDLIVEPNKKIDGRKVYILFYEQRQLKVTSQASKRLLGGANDEKDGLNHRVDPSSKQEGKNTREQSDEARGETDTDGFITVSRKRKSRSTLMNANANSPADVSGRTSSGDRKHSGLKQNRGHSVHPSSSPPEASRLTSRENSSTEADQLTPRGDSSAEVDRLTSVGEFVKSKEVAFKNPVKSRVTGKNTSDPTSARSKLDRAKLPRSTPSAKSVASEMKAQKKSGVVSEASAKLSDAPKRIKSLNSSSNNSDMPVLASVISNSSSKHEADSDADMKWLLSLSKENVYGRFHFTARDCDKFKVLTSPRSSRCQLCNKQTAGVPVLACKTHINHVFCACCARHLLDSNRKDSVLCGDDEYETDLEVSIEQLIRVSTAGAWLATTDVAVGIQFIVNEFKQLDTLDMIMPHRAKVLARTSRARFHLCPQFASRARHHMLWVFGRDMNGERILWWFDSLLDEFTGEVLFSELEKPLNITSQTRLIGERQKDHFSCGLFTVWAAGIIAKVLCQNSQAPCAEITPKLQDAFAEATFDPENARRFLQYSFRGLTRISDALIYLSDLSAEYPSLMIGDTHINALLEDQSNSWWFNSQMGIEAAPLMSETNSSTVGKSGTSFLELESPLNDATLAVGGDSNDAAQMDVEENRSKDAENTGRNEDPLVEASLKGRALTKVKLTPLDLPCPMPTEPREGTTSDESLNMLLKNVKNFPIEKFCALANTVLQFYPSWVDNLNIEDYKKFTSELVNIPERIQYDGRELTQASEIKHRKTKRSYRYISFACSCRYESELKKIGGTEGKQQRNRVSYKTNCKRTASVSSELRFSHEHNCQPRPQGSKVQSVRAATNQISNEEEKSIMENLRHLIIVLKLNKEQLRRQVLAQLGSRASMELADHYIRLVREEIARQTDRSDPVNSFLEYMNREVDESQREIRAPYISLDGDLVLDKPVRLLQGVAYRESHWAHPKNFFMFFVDGTDKLVLHDYVCIPIFGLSQDFLLNLVAFVIAASESHSAFDLGLTVLARADPTLWRRQTIWMSDETAGLVSALEGHNTKNGGQVRHLFCLLHKAANVEMRSGTVNLAPNEGGVSMDEAAKFEKETREAKDLFDKVQARVSNLPDRRQLKRDPVQKRKFSSWLNCYSCPSNDDSDRRWTCWLSYMRPAPTREELLVRLDEFRRTTNAKLSYVISLYRTASRWALCMQEPSPDLGFGTNNPTEAAISRLKSHAGPSKLLLSEAPRVLNSFRNFRESVTRSTKTGVSSSSIQSLRSRLETVFPTLINHLQSSRVTLFGQVRILENAEDARGFCVRRLPNLHLSSRDRIDSWEQSAFALRFIQICDRLKELPDGEQLMRVTDNDGIRYFVLVLNNGSYLCSCGYTVQHAGLPCPHVMAAFEQGYLRFRARRNLHMLYLRMEDDLVPDYTRVPEYISCDLVGDVGQKNCRLTATRVSLLATWNPFDNPRIDVQDCPLTLVDVLRWLEQERSTPLLSSSDPKRLRLIDTERNDTTDSEVDIYYDSRGSDNEAELRSDADAPYDDDNDTLLSTRSRNVSTDYEEIGQPESGSTAQYSQLETNSENRENAKRSINAERVIQQNNETKSRGDDEHAMTSEDPSLTREETIREIGRHLRGIKSDPNELEEFKQAILKYAQHIGLRTYHKSSSALGFASLKRLLDRCTKVGREDFVSKFAVPFLDSYRQRNILKQRKLFLSGKVVGLTPKKHAGSKRRRGSNPIDNFTGKRKYRRKFKTGSETPVCICKWRIIKRTPETKKES